MAVASQIQQFLEIWRSSIRNAFQLGHIIVTYAKGLDLKKLQVICFSSEAIQFSCPFCKQTLRIALQFTSFKRRKRYQSVITFHLFKMWQEFRSKTFHRLKKWNKISIQKEGKPFNCLNCDKNSGAKPFTCSKCEKKFWFSTSKTFHLFKMWKEISIQKFSFAK